MHDEVVSSGVLDTLKINIAGLSVHFLFSDHVGLTDDPAFVDNALHLLLEVPRFGAGSVISH